MVDVTDGTWDQEVLQAQQPVVVDLWAPWCGPCRAQTPIVEELSREYEGRAHFAKLNTDDNPRTASKYGVFAIPTLLFFKDGKEMSRLAGLQSRATIRRTLEDLGVAA